MENNENRFTVVMSVLISSLLNMHIPTYAGETQVTLAIHVSIGQVSWNSSQINCTVAQVECCHELLSIKHLGTGAEQSGLNHVDKTKPSKHTCHKNAEQALQALR